MERETRFLLLTLVLVVLPSVLLSYAGLATIRQEGAELEEQAREAGRRYALEVLRELERMVAQRELALTALLADPVAPAYLRERTAELGRKIAQDGMFGPLVLADPTGALLEPVETEAPGTTPPPLPELVAAERLEATGDPTAALARYRQLARDLAGDSRAARALLGEARCLERTGAHGEASAALRRLVTEQPTATLATGQWSARGALRRLAETASSDADAARTWLELLDLASRHAEKLPPDQRRHAVELAEQALAALLRRSDDRALHAAWAQHQERARARDLERTRADALLAQVAGPLGAIASGTKPPIGHFAQDTSEPPTCFLYGVIRDGRGALAIALVPLNLEPVAAEVLGRAAVHPELAPRFRGAAGPVGPGPEPGWSLVASQAATDLPLAVLVYARAGAAAERWGALRGSVFAGLIALALFGILLGCAIVLRAVTRELRAARLKSDFVGNVTHELKTPLTSIRMFVETLRLGRVRSEDQRAQFLDRIERETGRLQRLIDRVLEFSKLDRGVKTFRFEPADPGEIATQAVRLFEAERAGTRDFALEVTVGAPLRRVEVDLEAMVEVVLNLLQNAYKYSDPPREIALRVGTPPGRLEIAVQDHGIGIPAREQRRIFKRFYRVDDRLARKADGAGLGLALVHAIVKAHGGKVDLVSAPGAGSTFTVVIPTGPATPEEGADGKDPRDRG